MDYYYINEACGQFTSALGSHTMDAVETLPVPDFLASLQDNGSQVVELRANVERVVEGLRLNDVQIGSCPSGLLGLLIEKEGL